MGFLGVGMKPKSKEHLIGVCMLCDLEVWATYPGGKLKVELRHGAKGCQHEVDAGKQKGKGGK